MAEIDRLVAELAREQSGAFSRAQFLALGGKAMDLYRRIDAGTYAVHGPGLLVVASAPRERRLEVQCAVLDRPSAIVARRWALAWWGMGGFAPENVSAPVEVLAPSGTRASAFSHLVRARTIDPADHVPMTDYVRDVVRGAASDRRRIRRGGQANMRTVRKRPDPPKLDVRVRGVVIVPRVTTPPRTIVDIMRDGGLAERDLDRVIDDALTQAMVTVEAVDAFAARVLGARTPGVTRVRAQLAKRAGTPIPDSELERRMVQVFRDVGCPRPVLQYPLPGRHPAEGRIDFAFPEQRVVVELDGRRWHQSEASFQKDRARDNAVTLAGWRLFRFTWFDVTSGQRELRRSLAEIFGLPIV